MRIQIDYTQLWRYGAGLEPIALDLFSEEAVRRLEFVPVVAGRMSVVLMQTTIEPQEQIGRSLSLLLHPEFAPTPLMQLLKRRVVRYIHDLFLLMPCLRKLAAMPADQNWRDRDVHSISAMLSLPERGRQ